MIITAGGGVSFNGIYYTIISKVFCTALCLNPSPYEERHMQIYSESTVQKKLVGQNTCKYMNMHTSPQLKTFWLRLCLWLCRQDLLLTIYVNEINWQCVHVVFRSELYFLCKHIRQFRVLLPHDISRGEIRAIIGGGDEYSDLLFLPGEFLLNSLVIRVDFKRNSLGRTRIYEWTIGALVSSLDFGNVPLIATSIKKIPKRDK